MCLRHGRLGIRFRREIGIAVIASFGGWHRWPTLSEARVNPDDSADLARRNAVAWDRTATKYAADVDADVALLRAGGTNLLPAELRVLAPLLRHGGRVVHLQCSHGLDTLSLWRLGATAVVGLDFSERLLALAEEKAARLHVPATRGARRRALAAATSHFWPAPWRK